MKNNTIRLLSLIMALCMVFCCGVYSVSAQSDETETTASETESVTTDTVSDTETDSSIQTSTGIQENTQDGVILHAFCWSYDTIKENLSAIAEAGYSTIQTSPVQQPKNYGDWYDVTGQYWKLYQPLTYSIATESWLGTKEDLTELCTEAHKYGIKIICDVVMNHLANDLDGNLGTLYDGIEDTLPEIYADYTENYSVSTFDQLKYLHGYNKAASDSNLQSIVQGYVNNMISVNTGSEYIQQLAIGLLEECVDCGVDGFRFDAAKHIETPDDGEYASDYWPNVLGTTSDYASETQDGKELYYYGEILNTPGTGRDISSYTKYISITDNKESDTVAYYVYSGNAQSAYNMLNYNGTGYYMGADADKTVLWAESHDTYLGTSGSGGISSTSNYSDEDIIKAWALNATRKDATALYFARPGVLMAEVGDLSWKSTAVSEINKFHNYFVGESESTGYSEDLVYNQRGTTGIVIVNTTGTDTDMSISGLTMDDGTYIDTITGNTFTVSAGTITGQIGSTGVAVVYDGAVSPKISVSQGNTSFKGDTYTFTATAENAQSGTYQIGDGEVVSFTDTVEITVGEGYDYNTKIPVTLTAVNGELSSTVTYYYEKLEPANTGVYVFFDNSKTQYDEVYCYAFDRYNSDDDYSIKNKSWPGEKMDYDEASGLYYYEVPNVSDTITVPASASVSGEEETVTLDLLNDSTSGIIFTNGTGDQYPLQSSKLVLYLNGTNHILTSTNAWGETDFKIGDDYGMLGDCNGDGEITISDTTYIQKYIAGTKKLVSVAEKNADVNGDGVINIDDATLIQKYCLGMSTGYDIGVDKSGTVVEETTESTTAATVPTASSEDSFIFYVVAKTPGSSSIFSSGCKMWIYNNDTGESVATTKQEADSDDEVVYAYAEIPNDWTNLTFYRTDWLTTELDINSALNTFVPATTRTDGANAITISMSSTKYQWVTDYVPS